MVAASSGGAAARAHAGISPLVDRGPWGGVVTDLAIDPLDPRVLLASAGSRVFRSSDQGSNWAPTELPGSSTIAFAPSDPGRVYALKHGSGPYPTDPVWRSDDSGATWAPVSAPISSRADALVVSPANPDLVYASYGFQEPLMSADGGRTWRSLGTTGLPIDTIQIVHRPHHRPGQ
jgi:photosystem II stability/assembly factor-like uncharacterized protein